MDGEKEGNVIKIKRKIKRKESGRRKEREYGEKELEIGKNRKFDMGDDEELEGKKKRKKKKEEKLLLLLFGEIVKKIVKKIVKEAEGGREKLGMLKCNNGKRDQISKKRRK